MPGSCPDLPLPCGANVKRIALQVAHCGLVAPWLNSKHWYSSQCRVDVSVRQLVYRRHGLPCPGVGVPPPFSLFSLSPHSEVVRGVEAVPPDAATPPIHADPGCRLLVLVLTE